MQEENEKKGRNSEKGEGRREEWKIVVRGCGGTGGVRRSPLWRRIAASDLLRERVAVGGLLRESVASGDRYVGAWRVGGLMRGRVASRA
jgi:hypothetical protein